MISVTTVSSQRSNMENAYNILPPVDDDKTKTIHITNSSNATTTMEESASMTIRSSTIPLAKRSIFKKLVQDQRDWKLHANLVQLFTTNLKTVQ